MIANVQHWTELIAKKLSGNIRDDESRMLDAWISRDPEHKEYYLSMTRVWEVTDAVNPVAGNVVDDWSSLQESIQIPAAKQKIVRVQAEKAEARHIPWRMIAAAAAVVLVCVLGITMLFREAPVPEPVVVQATTPEPLEITLPDGSQVALRQGSSLSYLEEFDERSVTLSGEAFFSVIHDEEHPFTVTAGNGVVRVLGTKFNVVATEDGPVELFVEEGRVAFAPTTRKFDAKIFSSGQAGMLTSQSTEVERTASPGINVLSWVSGSLIFDNATLDHVLADITRHFDVKIDADSSLYACELKANFDHATLENVIETLRFSLNLEIDSSGSVYHITGTPCATETEN